MIWIDMEKPKSCWWVDPDNNLIAHKCPFLDREHECILQARINLTCEKRYENCPLHEVTADGDTVSRQAVLDAIFSEPLYKSGMKKRDVDIVVPAIYEKIKALPPSPTEGIPIEWINEHLEYLDNCDNDFAQLAKVAIRAMVSIWEDKL